MCTLSHCLAPGRQANANARPRKIGGKESSTHLPPSITIQVIFLDHLDGFSLLERDLVLVLWLEVVETIYIVWHRNKVVTPKFDPTEVDLSVDTCRKQIDTNKQAWPRRNLQSFRCLRRLPSYLEKSRLKMLKLKVVHRQQGYPLPVGQQEARTHLPQKLPAA